MSGWQMSFHNMGHVHTFAWAEQVWNDAVPWKNELTSWRPLAERRARHKRIVRINDGEAYQCVLYHTPVVTYHRNGDLELCTYNSIATRDFAYYIKPTHLSVENVGSTMYWGYLSQEGQRFIRQAGKPLCLEYVGTNQYNLITKPGEDTEWVLDRKAAAGVRSKLRHYDKWEKMTSRLLGKRVAHSHIRPTRAGIAALLAEPERIELFPGYFEELGSVEFFHETAYEVAGARYKVPVPYDRLPRRQR